MKNLRAQTSDAMRIGALARQTGCTIATIRYYEQVGLIPPAARRATGHRVYEPKAAQLLGFIRRCRDLGFTIEQIRTLVSLTGNEQRDCVEARDIAKSHLDYGRHHARTYWQLARCASHRRVAWTGGQGTLP